jgi:hypothetical protein
MAGACVELNGAGHANWAQREAVDWIDADVEAFLCDGAGADVAYIRVGRLLAAVGFGVERRKAFNLLGLRPEAIALMALYRLGWRRVKAPSGGRQTYARASAERLKSPRPSVLAALVCNFESYLATPRGQTHKVLRVPELLRLLDATDLDFEQGHRITRRALRQLGWYRFNDDEQAYRRRPDIYRKPPRAESSACASEIVSSTHHDAGALPAGSMLTSSSEPESAGHRGKGRSRVQMPPM